MFLNTNNIKEMSSVGIVSEHAEILEDILHLNKVL